MIKRKKIYICIFLSLLTVSCSNINATNPDNKIIKSVTHLKTKSFQKSNWKI